MTSLPGDDQATLARFIPRIFSPQIHVKMVSRTLCPAARISLSNNPKSGRYFELE